MRNITFTASGHSREFGNFAAGDTGRVDDALAKHLVEDARCAEYDDAVQTPAPAPTSTPAVKTTKKGSKQ